MDGDDAAGDSVIERFGIGNWNWSAVELQLILGWTISGPTLRRAEGKKKKKRRKHGRRLAGDVREGLILSPRMQASFSPVRTTSDNDDANEGGHAELRIGWSRPQTVAFFALGPASQDAIDMKRRARPGPEAGPKTTQLTPAHSAKRAKRRIRLVSRETQRAAFLLGDAPTPSPTDLFNRYTSRPRDPEPHTSHSGRRTICPR